jgi:pilus assembly protein CpaE
MAREALLVARAAGPEDTAGEVLARFGFTKIHNAETVAQAIEQLRQKHVDLVVLPLDGVADLQLATLEREIRRERYTAVIGTAPKQEPEIMLRAMRAGIQEFLVSPPDPKDFAAAVDRLMRRTQASTENGEVIAVYSAKGGLGVSSVATNLAYGFAKNHPGARTALADLVVGAGDVRVLLNLNPSYDLGDLVAKIDRVDAELLNSLLTPTNAGVWVLPAPDQPEADDAVDANTITMVIQHLRHNFAFTVLDCEHYLNERTLSALDAADRLVLVTHLSVAALRSTQRTVNLCRRLGYPNEKLCVVVNRWQSGEVLSPSDAEDVLKAEIFFKLPNDYRVASGSLTNGKPISEFEPTSKLAYAYTQLAAKLGGGDHVKTNGASAHQNGTTGGSRLKNLFARKRS